VSRHSLDPLSSVHSRGFQYLPAAPVSLSISATLMVLPKAFFLPLAAHSSQNSPMVVLGVICIIRLRDFGNQQIYTACPGAFTWCIRAETFCQLSRVVKPAPHQQYSHASDGTQNVASCNIGRPLTKVLLRGCSAEKLPECDSGLSVQGLSIYQ